MAKRKRALHVSTVRRTLVRLTAKAVTERTWITDCSGDCSSPIFRPMFGRNFEDTEKKADYHSVELWVRCRKCPECLRFKRRVWIRRMLNEVEASKRSWFVTLTFRPSFWIKKVGYNQVNTCILPDGRYAHERVAVQAAQMWMKRLRSAADVPIRYVQVVEPHLNGFPHLHCLVHESGEPIKRAVRRAAWRDGFIQWKLLPLISQLGSSDQAQSHAEVMKACGYCASYLVKQGGRVRASLRYGEIAHLLPSDQIIA